MAEGLPSAWCMAAAALMQHGIAQPSKAAGLSLAPRGCRGHAAAQRALGGLQMEDRPEAADLVFKG